MTGWHVLYLFAAVYFAAWVAPMLADEGELLPDRVWGVAAAGTISLLWPLALTLMGLFFAIAWASDKWDDHRAAQRVFEVEINRPDDRWVAETEVNGIRFAGAATTKWGAKLRLKRSVRESIKGPTPIKSEIRL